MYEGRGGGGSVTRRHGAKSESSLGMLGWMRLLEGAAVLGDDAGDTWCRQARIENVYARDAAVSVFGGGATWFRFCRNDMGPHRAMLYTFIRAELTMLLRPRVAITNERTNKKRAITRHDRTPINLVSVPHAVRATRQSNTPPRRASPLAGGRKRNTDRTGQTLKQ